MALRGGIEASSYRRFIIFIVVGMASILPGVVGSIFQDLLWGEVGHGGVISEEELREPTLQVLKTVMHGITVVTLLEWTVVCIAMATAVLSMAYVRVQDEPAAPIVSMVSFWTGMVSLFFVLAFHGFGTEVVNPEEFVHLNWTLTQTSTALIFLIGALFMLQYRDKRPVGTKSLLGLFVVFALLAYTTVALIANAEELPNYVRAEGILKRPLDLIPLGLFGLALFVVFPRLDKMCNSMFSFALWLAAVPLFMSQIHVVLFSPALFDGGFISAQLTRVVAFGLIFGGLAWDYARASGAESKLRRDLSASHRRTNLLIHNAAEAVITFREDQEILQINPAAHEMFWSGDPPRDIERIEEIFGDQDEAFEDRMAFLEHLEEVRARPEETMGFRTQNRMVLYDSSSREKKTIEYVLASAEEPSGDLIFALLARDVSERESLQLRTIQLDRLVAVGTLAAGIAHEINNPLSYVTTNLELVKEYIIELQRDYLDKTTREKLFAELKKACRAAEDGSERVLQIAGDLRFFSHVSPEKPRPGPILPPLEVAIRMTRGEIQKTAQLKLTVEETALVEVDDTRLSQVFVNLIINAAQAMERSEDEQNLLHIRVYLEEGFQVIAFQDTGPGISEGLQNQIFAPFFTTKPAGKGSGLGLSLAQSIVEDFGGSLEMNSINGRGSTFYVRLPAL